MPATVRNHKRRTSSTSNKTTRGGRKWSLKYKKSINCRRPRGFSQRQHCKYGRRRHHHPDKTRMLRKQNPQFNQSGGDIFNYLPSDVSMSLRSIGHSMSSVVSGAKGFQPSPSPLPFNDHNLTKTEVAASDRIPDIKTYYQNAINLVPSL